MNAAKEVIMLTKRFTISCTICKITSIRGRAQYNRIHVPFQFRAGFYQRATAAKFLFQWMSGLKIRVASTKMRTHNYEIYAQFQMEVIFRFFFSIREWKPTLMISVQYYITENS